MSELRESPGNRTVRLGKESKIKDYFNAHDMNKVNEELETYPYGKERQGITLEEAHHIARGALRNHRQDTEEIDVVVA